MQQTFDPAVDPRLIRQARIVPVVRLQGAAILKKAAGRPGIAGIDHAVAARKGVRPPVRHVDFPADAGFAENRLTVSLQKIPHRGVRFLHGDHGIVLRPGKKKIS